MEIFVVDTAGIYRNQADMGVIQGETETEVQQKRNTDGDDIQSSRVIRSGKLNPACVVAEKGSFELLYPYIEIRIRPSTWQSICKQGHNSSVIKSKIMSLNFTEL